MATTLAKTERLNMTLLVRVLETKDAIKRYLSAQFFGVYGSFCPLSACHAGREHHTEGLFVS